MQNNFKNQNKILHCLQWRITAEMSRPQGYKTFFQAQLS